MVGQLGLVGRFVVRSFGWLVGWLVGWLFTRSLGRSVGWLAGWQPAPPLTPPTPTPHSHPPRSALTVITGGRQAARGAAERPVCPNAAEDVVRRRPQRRRGARVAAHRQVGLRVAVCVGCANICELLFLFLYFTQSIKQSMLWCWQGVLRVPATGRTMRRGGHAQAPVVCRPARVGICACA